MAKMTSRGAMAAMALGIGAAVAAGGAMAHDDHMPKNPSAAARAAHVRHGHFETLGKAFKAIGDEIKKPDASMALIKTNAAEMRALSTGLPTWFPKGSGVEARPKSEAKPNIWTDQAGFSAAAANMQLQTSKLNLAAQSGDLDAVKAQFRPTGGSCKGCHDKFRQEKKKS